MTEIIVPNAPCPGCGYKMDRATCVSDHAAAPKPGDYTICINCSEILIFDRKLRTRRPTDREMIALQTGCRWPMVQKAVALTRMQKQRRDAKQAANN